MTEVLAMCDFCREPAPAEPWAYPAKDFAAIIGNIVLDFPGASLVTRAWSTSSATTSTT
jgi:hypothetical protein